MADPVADIPVVDMMANKPDGVNIFGLLNRERTVCAADLGSKKRALEAMGRLLAVGVTAHSEEQIFDCLITRERLGSTGLGGGVALPHCRLPRLRQPCAALITLSKPIDFDSQDRQGVDILLGLAAPAQHDEAHLRILARLARLLGDAALCRRIRADAEAADILQTIHHWQQNAGA